ncbi:MAG TPA: AzlD domain-containing protein [Clostridiaceae bacterium]|nr:AzlD domain-containing protein [Clostridiaceae bacterium]
MNNLNSVNNYNNLSIYAIIIGMAVVTYIPRVLPVFIMERFKMPKWVNRWLQSIPYAALGALIFPGILTVESEVPIIGIIGGAVALIISWFKVNVIFSVLGSILAVMIAKMFI